MALKDGIVNLIKDAILKPIAAFAQTTSGYPLLCTVMGKDPITGEAVPQDADALLGGFMKFIGEEELWRHDAEGASDPARLRLVQGRAGGAPRIRQRDPRPVRRRRSSRSRSQTSS